MQQAVSQYKTTNEVQASLPSFQRHLRAENLSRATLETYSAEETLSRVNTPMEFMEP